MSTGFSLQLVMYNNMILGKVYTSLEYNIMSFIPYISQAR
jgi:hypothetical protein